MVKYVIFDFDGTLADSRKALLKSWNIIAKQYYFREINLNEMEKMKKLSIKERGRYLQFPMFKMPIVMPKFYQLYRESINEVKLYDGIAEMLAELERKGYKTIIISSNSKENIMTFLKSNKLTSIANVICSSSIFGKNKLIHRFLRGNNLKPSEVIYVGDEKRDILACKKLALK